MMPQGSTFTTRPQLAGTFGMVASTHWLASAAGMAVLEKGGNAFDAAVAAGLVLQVVEPHLNGPGGEVPVIGYDAGRGEAFVLDGQGPAPQAATVAAFGALGLDLVPGSGLLARLRPRRVRDLDAAARRARPAAAARGDGVRDRLRAGGLPGGARASAPASRRWPAPSASTGPARPRSTWRTGCRRRAHASPTPSSRRPTSGCWTRRRRRARAGRRRSRRPAAPSTRASWPRRSGRTPSAREVMDVTGERHRALLDRR